MSTNIVGALGLALAFGSASAQQCLTPWTSEEAAPTQCHDRALDLYIEADGTQHLLYYDTHVPAGGGELWHVSRAAGQPWDPATSTFVALSAAPQPSLAVDIQGTPFVIWSDPLTETEAVLAKLAGAWTPFGPALASGAFVKGGQGAKITMNMDNPPEPVVAYFYGAAEDAYLSLWVTDDWNTLPVETDHRVGKSMSITLAPPPTEHPILAYNDQDEETTHVAEWIDNQFVIATIAGLTEPRDVLVDVAGVRWVLGNVGTNQSAPLGLYRRVDGAWEPDGSFPGGPYSYAQMAVDSHGGLHVAASDTLGRIDYLTRDPLSGVWQVQTLALDGYVADIELTPQGRPVVAFVQHDDRVVVMQQTPVAWSTLDCALSGASGTPELTGSGCPIAGDVVSLDVTSARKFAPASLVVGTTLLNAPFKGGCLVPSVDLLVQLFVDGLGEIHLPAIWPSGVPAGLTLYFQVWITDATGPQGFTSTNGVSLITP